MMGEPFRIPRSVDLNLLVALDALLSERHVTRASERVGLSQPAMSNALNRLRGMFGDELLVRTATGMKATPATELVEPLRQLLRQFERVLESDSGFDPADVGANVHRSDVRYPGLPDPAALDRANAKVGTTRFQHAASAAGGDRRRPGAR